MFSPIEQKCVKSTFLETIDDIDDVVGWRKGNWTVVAKKSSVVSYFSNFCSSFDTESECRHPNCGWNMGKIGRNQIRVVELGWCGRIKC